MVTWTPAPWLLGHGYLDPRPVVTPTIPHGESFLALGFAYPLLYSLQSCQCYPTQLQDS